MSDVFENQPLLHSEEHRAGCAEHEPEGAIRLHIPDALCEKLNRALISGQEIRDTVAACERTGRRIWDEEQKAYTGYLKVGYATYWARYRKLPDGSFELVNAYSHKIEIGGVI